MHWELLLLNANVMTTLGPELGTLQQRLCYTVTGLSFWWKGICVLYLYLSCTDTCHCTL